MADIEYIEYDHPDLELQYEDIIYTIQYEGKQYWVCGFRPGDSDDYEWSAQQNVEGSDNLDLIEDGELANKVLIRFFEIIEEAALKGKKITNE